ncbi:MAG: nitrous oxide-stimulated promoter family protein [Dehalococcoidia bacterium]|jgi:hypothetical protein
MKRIEREKRTVEAMIALHCAANHSTKGDLCEECQKLRDYAFARLDRCPFGARKPTCARCPVHCYKHNMKDQIRGVMRYSGPRMLYRHPALALMHELDSLRKRGESQSA